MFADETIFCKTPLGHQELSKSHTSRLPRAMRNFLILVDGQKNLAQHRQSLQSSAFLKANSTVEEHFKTLKDLGLIQPKDGNEHHAEPIKSKQAQTHQQPYLPVKKSSTSAVEKELKFKEIQSLVIEYVESELGSSNWEATLDLERCQNPAELCASIKKTYDKHGSSLSRNGKKILKDSHRALSQLIALSFK